MNLSLSKTTRLLRTAIAAALAFVLVAFAPGLAPYEAAAQVVNGSFGRGVGAPIVPGGVVAIPAGINLAPALGSGFNFGAAPSVSIGLTPAPGAAAVSAAFTPAAAFPALPSSAFLSAPSAAASASVPANALSASNSAASRALAAAADGRDGAPVTARGQLSGTVQALESADAGSKAGFLDKLFTGARSLFGLNVPAPVAASANASGLSAPSGSFAALTPAPTRLLAASTPDETKAASGESRATPPSPVTQVSDGLNPGSTLLAGSSAPAAKPEAPVQGPSNDDWIDTKGMIGMFTQRSISIALFIQTALAYPFIAIHAVGTGTFGVLMALGPLAAIATGPLNGLIADKMSPRTGLIMLSLIRAAQVGVFIALAHFHLLNFGTLLAMSIANGWQLSLLMTSENAYLRRLAGKNHLGNLNALNAVNYLALQVFLTLILGVGALIDKMGPMMPYYASAIILPLIVCPIIWFMVPNTTAGVAAKAKVQAAKKTFSEGLKSALEKAKSFVKKYWKEIGIMGASLGVYLAYHTTLPMSGALVYWVTRTDSFKAVWSQKILRAPMLLSGLAFGLIFPFQYMALPLMAGVIGGAAGKAAILSQMLGALFFGQLAANASQANKLPSVKIPFTKYKLPAQLLVQGLVLALGAAWTVLRLFPGNWLAAAASVGIGSALMFGASKFTDKGWIKFLGLGLAAATILPLMFFTTLPLVFTGMLALGLFVGPVQVVLNTYFGKNATAAGVGNAFGVSSSLNNAATSFGYGLLTLTVGLFHPMFPHALGPIAVAFGIIGGIFFFLGPKLLPGLSGKLFASRKPADKPAEKKS